MPYDLLDKNKIDWSVKKFLDDFKSYAGENEFDPNQDELNEKIPLLCCAAKHKKYNAFVALIQSKANVDQIDTNNLCSVLHYACLNSHDDMIIELLDRNAQVNLTDLEGNTPLHLVAAQGRMHIFQLLLQKKASEASVNSKGKNPFQLLSSELRVEAFLLACAQERKDIIRLLLSDLTLAKPNSSDSDSPQMSTYHEYDDVIEKLVGQGTGKEPVPSTQQSTSFRFCAIQPEDRLIIDLLNDLMTGMPLLCCAVKYKLSYAFTTFIRSKADANQVDASSRTALHYACELQQDEMVKQLLDQNAKIDVQDREGNTPLHLTAAQGSMGNFKLLIQKKASVICVNSSGKNPLQLLPPKTYPDLFHIICTNVKSCPQEFIAYLSSQGVNPETNINSTGDVPSEQDCIVRLLNNFTDDTPLLCYAVNHEKLFTALLRLRPDLNKVNKDGRTALHLACHLQCTTMVKQLIKMKAPLDKIDAADNTPLHLSAAAGNIEIDKELITAGADFIAKNREGKNPLELLKERAREELLIFACEIGKIGLVEKLVQELSVNVNARSQNDTTPLHNAVFNGHEVIVSFLLSQGATIDPVNKTSSTPLHFAARQGRVNIAIQLIEHKANVLAIDQDGFTPLMHILESNVKIFSLQLQEIVGIFLQRPEYNEREIAQRRTTEGYTYLCLAISVRAPFEIVEQLIIDDAAYINHISPKGAAMHVALMKHEESAVYCQKTIAKLRKKGASLEVRNVKQQTPIHIAAGFETKTELEILLSGLELEKKKELLAIQDQDGNTPLHIAAIKFLQENYDLLIKNGSPTGIRNKAQPGQQRRLASAIYSEWLDKHKHAKKSAVPPSLPQDQTTTTSQMLDTRSTVVEPSTAAQLTSIDTDESQSVPSLITISVPPTDPESARSLSTSSDPESARSLSTSSDPESARSLIPISVSSTAPSSTLDARKILYPLVSKKFGKSKKDRVMDHLRKHKLAYALAGILLIAIMCGFFALCAFIPFIAKAIPIVYGIQKLLVVMGMSSSSSLLHTLAQLITVTLPIILALTTGLVIGVSYAIDQFIDWLSGSKKPFKINPNAGYELVSVVDPDTYVKTGKLMDTQNTAEPPLTAHFEQDVASADPFGFKLGSKQQAKARSKSDSSLENNIFNCF